MPGAGEHGAAAARNRLGRGLPPCRGSDGSFEAYRSTALAETFSGSDVPKLQINGALAESDDARSPTQVWCDARILPQVTTETCRGSLPREKKRARVAHQSCAPPVCGGAQKQSMSMRATTRQSDGPLVVFLKNNPTSRETVGLRRSRSRGKLCQSSRDAIRLYYKVLETPPSAEPTRRSLNVYRFPHWFRIE